MQLLQDTIYYKWASVKMTLKFHFLWSTLFWLEENVSAVYSAAAGVQLICEDDIRILGITPGVELSGIPKILKEKDI